MANFDGNFFGLVFPGFQATEKIHAQNSRPELSAFLSNFTFLNPKFIHGDFLLTGETNKCGSRSKWDLGAQGRNAKAPARNNAPGGSMAHATRAWRKHALPNS